MSEPKAQVVSLRARLSSLLSLSSAGVVVVTFFLPAVRGCTQPVRPVEVPSLAGIYGFGLVVAILAVYALRGRLVPRALGWLTWIYALGGSLVNAGNCAYLLYYDNPKQLGPRLLLGGSALISLAGCGLLLAVVRSRGRRLAWAALVGSSQVLGFFVRIVASEPRSNILYGMWMSLTAALVMTVGAALIWDRLAVED